MEEYHPFCTYFACNAIVARVLVLHAWCIISDSPPCWNTRIHCSPMCFTYCTCEIWLYSSLIFILLIWVQLVIDHFFRCTITLLLTHVVDELHSTLSHLFHSFACARFFAIFPASFDVSDVIVYKDTFGFCLHSCFDSPLRFGATLVTLQFNTHLKWVY